MQEEKDEKKWIDILSTYGVKGINQLYGFYSFYNIKQTIDFKIHDNMPFIHALAFDGDAVKKTVTHIYGINLNLLDYKTRIAYINSLDKISNGLFGSIRKPGEVYINELHLIHPVLKSCLRRYTVSNLKNILFIKNEDIKNVIRYSIGIS